MVQYVITPWRHQAELLAVREALYGEERGRMGEGVERVGVWSMFFHFLFFAFLLLSLVWFWFSFGLMSLFSWVCGLELGLVLWLFQCLNGRSVFKPPKMQMLIRLFHSAKRELSSSGGEYGCLSSSGSQ